MAKATVEERFWSKVDKNGPIPEARPHLGPCWIWIGGRDNKGYGCFWLAGKTVKAHRVAWELLQGPIPPGHVPDHLCLVPACVNALHHLEVVTPRVNMLRGTVNPCAINARKTHCKHGHLLDATTTSVDTRGRRECRICTRRRSRETRLRRASNRMPRVRPTHCKHGHPFDVANTYWRTSTRWECRACRNRRRAELRQRARKENP